MGLFNRFFIGSTPYELALRLMDCFINEGNKVRTQRRPGCAAQHAHQSAHKSAARRGTTRGAARATAGQVPRGDGAAAREQAARARGKQHSRAAHGTQPNT